MNEKLLHSFGGNGTKSSYTRVTLLYIGQQHCWQQCNTKRFNAKIIHQRGRGSSESESVFVLLALRDKCVVQF